MIYNNGKFNNSCNNFKVFINLMLVPILNEKMNNFSIKFYDYKVTCNNLSNALMLINRIKAQIILYQQAYDV